MVLFVLIPKYQFSWEKVGDEFCLDPVTSNNYWMYIESTDPTTSRMSTSAQTTTPKTTASSPTETPDFPTTFPATSSTAAFTETSAETTVMTTTDGDIIGFILFDNFK